MMSDELELKRNPSSRSHPASFTVASGAGIIRLSRSNKLVLEL